VRNQALGSRYAVMAQPKDWSADPQKGYKVLLGEGSGDWPQILEAPCALDPAGGAGSMMVGLAGFEADAAKWIRMVGSRVPSYVRLLQELLVLMSDPELGPVIRRRMEAPWAGRRFEATYERPLLMLATLRASALEEGESHPLWPAIAGEPPSRQAINRTTVLAALSPERHFMYKRFAQRSVQTNETSRAVAWLWPAHLLGADDGARPLALVDIGASAGLNLIGDRLPAIWTDGAGGAFPVVQSPDVRLRLGLDARPLDARDDSSVSWLKACIWPGEPHRVSRLQAAVAAFRDHPDEGPAAPRVEQSDAEQMPARIDAATRDFSSDTVILAYQTIFIEYLAADVRRAYVDGMHSWLVQSPRRALWIELELTREPSRHSPAELRATFRGKDWDLHSVVLARCGYHPASVDVQPDGVASLLKNFR
jgi:hypothetical protein